MSSRTAMRMTTVVLLAYSDICDYRTRRPFDAVAKADGGEAAIAASPPCCGAGVARGSRPGGDADAELRTKVCVGAEKERALAVAIHLTTPKFKHRIYMVWHQLESDMKLI
ncbi:hypothetical protein HBH98_002670 [Parastagonospora nodorum]|nr:hypothetical protein HBH54_164130 [Parastagonospora nodorum]KAH3943151.1 hypothetical protein HBH53_175090 [Parastagonospora nodorum]KAH4047619.1 hypothetical protein HBH49_167520 [Parastagonospora nodorum]KAH4063753.1 hypothetical protein HBH50_186100 [Parastagonospora nodorum]KAH4079740.1 hypothetical protein HBH48_218100 [Parastagonospora nodorum]